MRTIFISDMTSALMVSGTQKAPLSLRKKVVRAIAGLNVDAIELPAIHREAEDTVITRLLAAEAGQTQIRIPLGIDEHSARVTLDAVKEIENLCVQVCYPVSVVLLEYRFHQKPAVALELIKRLLTLAKTNGKTVEFVMEDATNADFSYLEQLCALCTELGVNEITLQDAMGASVPSEITALVAFVRARFAGKLNVTITSGIGMGIACTLAAIDAGCDGIKTAVFDGNVSLAELARFLRVRGDGLGFTCSIDTTNAERTIADLYHVDARPHLATEESATFARLGADCTLTDVADAASVLGYELSEQDLGKVQAEIGRVAAKKGSIGRREFEAIIAGCAMAAPSTYHIESFVINSGNVISSTAQIVLTKDGESLRGVSVGDGPIDAAFQTIEQIIGHHYELEDFQISAVTRGREALGSALVKLRSGGKLYSGNGVSTDIVGAAIRAYVNALNKIVYEEA